MRAFRPPGGRYKERRRRPPVDGPPRSVKERLDRRYDPRCDNLGDWAAAGGAVARPHTTAGVSVQRSLRLGAQKFSRVKRSAALAALARAEDQARLIEAEARSPPPKAYRAPRTTTRPATAAFTLHSALGAATSRTARGRPRPRLSGPRRRRSRARTSRTTPTRRPHFRNTRGTAGTRLPLKRPPRRRAGRATGRASGARAGRPSRAAPRRSTSATTAARASTDC